MRRGGGRGDFFSPGPFRPNGEWRGAAGAFAYPPPGKINSGPVPLAACLCRHSQSSFSSSSSSSSSGAGGINIHGVDENVDLHLVARHPCDARARTTKTSLRRRHRSISTAAPLALALLSASLALHQFRRAVRTPSLPVPAHAQNQNPFERGAAAAAEAKM